MALKTKLFAAIGGAALALTAGAGVASADPDISAIVNSTCSYPQVMSALNAQSPDAAKQLQSSPAAVAYLQQLIASGPQQRTEMVRQVQAIPAASQYTGLINSVAHSCNNY